MHSVGELGSSGVPAFLTKLWTLVDDPSTDELICWDPSGRSFHVYDPSRFSKEYLPLYFKHSNIASFIRQLNMYGFRKVVNVESGGLKTERDDMEFTHQYFIRDQEALLEFIKRKVPNAKPAEEGKVEDLSRILGDVRNIKGKQETMSSKLETLKLENEALWREVANMRQKHHKQQQIVNKLIQFLLSLVGNHGLPSRKRTMPLMLNDVPGVQSKVPKMAKASESSDDSNSSEKKGLTIHDITDTELTSGNARVQSPPSTMVCEPAGGDCPVLSLDSGIPKVGADLETDLPIIAEQIDLSNITSATPVSAEYIGVDLNELGYPQSDSVPPPTLSTPLIQVPESPPSYNLSPAPSMEATATAAGVPTSVAANIAASMAASKAASAVAVPENFNSPSEALRVDVNLKPEKSKSVVPMSPNRDELGSHLDILQTDLDSLRDLLSGGQYSVDASTLLNLFGVDSSHNLGPLDLLAGSEIQPGPSPLSPMPSTSSTADKQLVQYNPMPDDLSGLFDFGLENEDSNLTGNKSPL